MDPTYHPPCACEPARVDGPNCDVVAIASLENLYVSFPPFPPFLIKTSCLELCSVWTCSHATPQNGVHGWEPSKLLASLATFSVSIEANGSPGGHVDFILCHAKLALDCLRLLVSFDAHPEGIVLCALQKFILLLTSCTFLVALMFIQRA